MKEEAAADQEDQVGEPQGFCGRQVAFGGESSGETQQDEISQRDRQRQRKASPLD